MKRLLLWPMRLLLVLGALLSALLLTVYLLLSSEQGCRWLLQQVDDALPQLRIDTVDGDLLQGLRLYKLAWQQPELEVDITNLFIQFDWSCLASLGICVEQLSAHTVALTLHDTPETTVTDEPPAGPLSLDIDLPDIALPLGIKLDLSVERLLYYAGEKQLSQQVNQVTAKLSGRSDQWQIQRLRLRHPMAIIDAMGSLKTSGDWPVTLTLSSTLGATSPFPGYKLKLAANESLHNLLIDAEFNNPQRAESRLSLKGQVGVLQPDLPLSVELTAHQLSLSEPSITLNSADLDISGDLTQFQTAMQGRVVWPEQRLELSFSSQSQGNSQQLDIQSLKLTGNQGISGDITAAGKVQWLPLLAWQADMSLQALDFSSWHASIPLSLSGGIVTQGEIANGQVGFSLNSQSLQGRWQQFPLAIDITAAQKKQQPMRIEQLQIKTGDNQLNISGTVSEQLDLTSELSVPKLEQLLPALAEPLYGRINAKAKLTGTQQQPRLDLSLQASQIELTQYKLDQATLSLKGTTNQHQLQIAVDGEPISSRLTIKGQLSEQAWQGTFLPIQLDTPIGRWQSDQGNISWDLTSNQGLLDVHCWKNQPASLCLDQPLALATSGTAQISLRDFAFSVLETYLPPSVQWQGELSANAIASWQPEQPFELALEADSTPGMLVITEEQQLQAQQLRLDYQQLAAKLNINQQGITSELKLRSNSLGNVTLQAVVQENASEVEQQDTIRSLTGTVSFDQFNIAGLQGVIDPSSNLEGIINANVQLAGTLSQPDLRGRLMLSDFVYQPVTYPIAIDRGELLVELDGQQARFDGQLNLNQGLTTIDGSYGWRDGDISGSLLVKGNRLALSYPPLADIFATPEITLSLTDNSLVIRGNIQIPEGQIVVETLPEGVVTYSEEIVVADVQSAEEDGAAGQLPLDMDITVTIGNQLQVSGQGLDGFLRGDLKLQQRPGRGLEIFGGLNLANGTFRRFGQQLSISRSEILFAGPPDKPTLDVEATREVTQDNDTIIVGLSVRGQAPTPTVDLFSRPALSDAEILSYITTGGPLRSGSSNDDQVLSNAALSIGVLGGQAVLDTLTEQWELPSLRLEARGKGEEAKVAIGMEIRPNLEVLYGVGVFQPVNELIVRYRLTEHLFLQAVSSLYNSMELFYAIKF